MAFWPSEALLNIFGRGSRSPGAVPENRTWTSYFVLHYYYYYYHYFFWSPRGQIQRGSGSPGEQPSDPRGLPASQPGK